MAGFSFLFFIALVIVLGIVTIRLRRKNRRQLSDALAKLVEEAEEQLPVQEPLKEEEAYVPPAAVSVDRVHVPVYVPFREEMELLLYLLKTYPDDMHAEFYKGLEPLSIAMFEQRTGIELTEELKQFFEMADGFSMGWADLDIYPLELIEKMHREEEYEWGDTQDYLIIGDMIGDGESVILDERSGRIICYDHGEVSDHGSLTELLRYIIDIFCEMDDSRLEEYRKRKNL